MIQRNGKIFHALGLEALIFLKWPPNPKQSTDSMQSLSKSQWHFYRNRKTYSNIHMESQGTLNIQNYLEKTKLEGSHYLTSKLTTKPQLSKQCDTGTRIDIYSIGLIE